MNSILFKRIIILKVPMHEISPPSIIMLHVWLNAFGAENAYMNKLHIKVDFRDRLSTYNNITGNLAKLC